ncbi:MAG: metallophosphoesterase [Kiloniellales bacterium]
MERQPDRFHLVARRRRSPIAAAAGLLVAAALVLPWQTRSAAAEPTEPVTVAFIGDQGLGPDARAVLELIKAQGADMVLHQGDFDYDDDPEAWDALLTGVLGADFPVFAAVGNHDRKRWSGPDGYQAKLQARLNRIPGAECSGDLGVRSACRYKNLFFLLSGIGTLPADSPDDPAHVSYLREQLARTTAVWRICSWHANQRLMQTGDKMDEVGWQAYETCREAGAIVATAHEHVYSRSHLMERFETQSVASTGNTLVLEAGRSFVFVSGLGGMSIRDQKRGGPWWAAVYTSDQGADFGALFCTFKANGEARRADCHFRDIRGRVPDRFTLISRVGTDAPQAPD